MATIRGIMGREIRDSRGNATVDAEEYLEEGGVGRAGDA